MIRELFPLVARTDRLEDYVAQQIMCGSALLLRLNPADVTPALYMDSEVSHVKSTWEVMGDNQSASTSMEGGEQIDEISQMQPAKSDFAVDEAIAHRGVFCYDFSLSYYFSEVLNKYQISRYRLFFCAK